jgi:hypothetical protein
VKLHCRSVTAPPTESVAMRVKAAVYAVDGDAWINPVVADITTSCCANAAPLPAIASEYVTDPTGRDVDGKYRACPVEVAESEGAANR